MCSLTASQLQVPHFDPELRLLSLQSFSCSLCLCMFDPYLCIRFTNMHYMHVFCICTKHDLFMDAWCVALIIENAVRGDSMIQWKMNAGWGKLITSQIWIFSLCTCECSSLTIHITTLVPGQMPDVFTLLILPTDCVFMDYCLFICGDLHWSRGSDTPTHSHTLSVQSCKLF